MNENSLLTAAIVAGLFIAINGVWLLFRFVTGPGSRWRCTEAEHRRMKERSGLDS